MKTTQDLICGYVDLLVVHGADSEPARAYFERNRSNAEFARVAAATAGAVRRGLFSGSARKPARRREPKKGGLIVSR